MIKKIENKNATKKLLRNIKLDYVGTFLANLNMQSCIWVLYLLYCGLNLAQVGFLEGIYHATSIVCEIPSGAVADLLGRKRSMVLGRICIALSCMIMLLTKNFWLFALSFMEKELVPQEKRAGFIETLERVMLAQPGNWQKHYHGDDKQLALARKYSFSDKTLYSRLLRI